MAQVGRRAGAVKGGVEIQRTGGDGRAGATEGRPEIARYLKRISREITTPRDDLLRAPLGHRARLCGSALRSGRRNSKVLRAELALDVHRAAMAFGHRLHDEQAEADPGGLVAPFLDDAREALEEPRQGVRRHAFMLIAAVAPVRPSADRRTDTVLLASKLLNFQKTICLRYLIFNKASCKIQ